MLSKAKSKNNPDKVLRVSYEIHKRLKLLATVKDMEIRELTNQILEEYIEKYEKRNKITLLEK